MAEAIGVGTQLGRILDRQPSHGTAATGAGREIDGETPVYDSGPEISPFAQWMSGALVNGGAAAKDNMIEGAGVAAGATALGGAYAWQKSKGAPGSAQLKGRLAVNAAKLLGPALVFSLLGPAAADGVSHLAPKAVERYERSMKPDKKNWVQTKRAIAGGAAASVIGTAVYLVRPQWLKPIRLAGDPMKAAAGKGGVLDPAKKVAAAVAPVATLPAAYAAYDHANISDAFGNTIGRLTRKKF